MDHEPSKLSQDNQLKTIVETAPVLIWISGSNSLPDFFNSGWLNFTGRTLEQEQGNGWAKGVHPDDFQRCQEIYENSFKLREEFKMEYRLRRHDGVYRWILDNGVPRYNTDGTFAGFIGSCVDIDDLIERQREMTELVAKNQRLEQEVSGRIKALSDSESSLRSLVMTAHYPLMILRGREWIIEIANQPLVNLWDKTIEGVTGHPLMTILPEIEDQPFPGYLRQVYDTGVGFGDEEQVFYYNSPTGPATKYVSYYYDPLRNEEGEVCGIIVAADDITEKVLSRQLLEKSYEEQQALNEEFASLNEELATTIEELSSSHDELAHSEERFRSLIRQAPVGICTIRASDLMVQEINDSYLELVGKRREEMENKTIWEAVAEAAEGYAPVMQSVIDTGIAFVAKEHLLVLVRNGVPENVYVDFVYEPVINSMGVVTTIMVVGIEITDKVIARQSIEDVEERNRLAVQAAQIGTFDYSYADDLMISSDRCKEIFGLEHGQSRQSFLDVMHPEDLHLSNKAHLEAQETGKMNYEARIILPNGGLRWIRIQANAYLDGDGKPVRLLGTVVDFTNQKILQQQKDDFLSIASHELKTPLTSLKASLQLLDRIKNNPVSPMLPKLIEQSGRSMSKINELVDDLLNVSRMNEGQVQLSKKKFTLFHMLNESCHDIRIAEDYKLVFEGDDQLEVLADEQRIDQVVVNFVNNAVKYAPNSKVIVLGVAKEGDYAKVSVRDNGPGIPEDKLPNIFDRYYRAEDTDFHISGLGLGLYISADIIKRHGGEIGVTSELGVGSTFWFTLPIQSI